MASSMGLTEQVDKLRLTVVTFGFQGGWYREGASEGEAPLYKNPDNIHVESLMTVQWTVKKPPFQSFST